MHIVSKTKLSACFYIFFFSFLPIISLECCSLSRKIEDNTAAVAQLQKELRAIVDPSVEEHKISSLISAFSKCNSSYLTSYEIERFRSSVLNPLQSLKIALIVVDYQNDFVNGSLAVGAGNAEEDPLDALPFINDLVDNNGVDQVVYTQDWHPYNHISFVNHAHDSDRVLEPEFQNKTLEPFDMVQFISPNTTQRLYPSHCIPGTWGALLEGSMTIANNSLYIHKGTEVLVDSYSAFKNNNGKLLELDSQLKSKAINAFVACGLAYDICVYYTCMDGSDLGYLVAVSPDCSKGFMKDGIDTANKYFEQKNIAVVSGAEAKKIFSRSFVPIEWVYLLVNKNK